MSKLKESQTVFSLYCINTAECKCLNTPKVNILDIRNSQYKNMHPTTHPALYLRENLMVPYCQAKHIQLKVRTVELKVWTVHN